MTNTQRPELDPLTPAGAFANWFAVNYPKGVIIRDPFWHAPKILNAARNALALESRSSGEAAPAEARLPGDGPRLNDSTRDLYERIAKSPTQFPADEIRRAITTLLSVWDAANERLAAAASPSGSPTTADALAWLERAGHSLMYYGSGIWSVDGDRRQRTPLDAINVARFGACFDATAGPPDETIPDDAVSASGGPVFEGLIHCRRPHGHDGEHWGNVTGSETMTWPNESVAGSPTAGGETDGFSSDVLEQWMNGYAIYAIELGANAAVTGCNYDGDGPGVTFERGSLKEAMRLYWKFLDEVPGMDDVGGEESQRAMEAWMRENDPLNPILEPDSASLSSSGSPDVIPDWPSGICAGCGNPLSVHDGDVCPTWRPWRLEWVSSGSPASPLSEEEQEDVDWINATLADDPAGTEFFISRDCAETLVAIIDRLSRSSGDGSEEGKR